MYDNSYMPLLDEERDCGAEMLNVNKLHHEILLKLLGVININFNVIN